MRTTRILFIALLGLSVGAACDSKEEDKKGDEKKGDAKKGDAKKGDAKAGGDGGAKAAGPAEVSLPKVGLKGTAPAGATVSELMGNDMVQAPGMAVTVEAGDDKPKTGEEAQKEADMYTPVEPKIETLPDGYVLTFKNTGSAGDNFWVQVRREIDGKAVWCSTMVSDTKAQQAGVDFCKSLKK